MGVPASHPPSIFVPGMPRLNGMTRFHRPYLLIFLFFVLAAAGAADDHSRFSNIRIENGRLFADYRREDLLDAELLDGLRKGLTASVEYQIRLFRDRPGWVKRIVTEKTLRLKIGWDNWERRYVLFYRQDDPDLFTGEGLLSRFMHINLPVCSVEELDPDTPYRIGIRIRVQPMAVENLDEMQRWLAGEARDLGTETIRASRSPLKRIRDSLLGVVVNLAGFGERVITETGPPFEIRDDAVRLVGGS